MAETFNPNYLIRAQEITTGFTTSVGVASGRIVFSKEKAYNLANQGEKVILVKNETEPSDFLAIKVSEGVLTSHGNIASNASINARTLGKCSIIAPSIRVKDNQMIVNNQLYNEGTIISLDGESGKIYLGNIPIINNPSWRDLHKQELKKNILKKKFNS